jgi:hypothetical protein
MHVLTWHRYTLQAAESDANLANEVRARQAALLQELSALGNEVEGYRWAGHCPGAWLFLQASKPPLSLLPRNIRGQHGTSLMLSS